MDWPEDAHTEQASPAALAVAKVWLDKLHTEVTDRGEVWIQPHITAQDGDVVFEWWRGAKSLSVYISETEAWYLQSAGPQSKQQDGDAVTEDARRELWRWLIGKNL